MSLLELNAWEYKWLVVVKALRKGKMKEKNIKKMKNEEENLICEQYIDACKLGANWDGQDFKNHAN